MKANYIKNKTSASARRISTKARGCS